MAWIDEVSYPWDNPAARELHHQLVDTFYEPAEVRTLVRSAKAPNAAKIDFNRSIDRVWTETLDRSVAEGALRTLLTFIVDHASVSAPFNAFVRDILQEASPPIPSMPGTVADGVVAPATMAEALVFGDDLSESVGAVPALLAAIERVMASRGAVCQLEVVSASGSTSYGTGTLLTANRVLTNHHVLYPQGQPGLRVSAKFHLELDAQGQYLKVETVDGDPGTIRSSKDDDWAVIALAGAAPVGVAPIDLAASVGKAKPTERAFILQHPLGGVKRLAFVRNQVSVVAERRVYYLTDTQGGSSGAPVFNAAGQIIALHRAGSVPQKFPGGPPVKNNEGVRMDVIASAILTVN